MVEGYVVGDQIGVGGFSRVYAAVQLDFDRPVAIKVMDARFTDERQRQEFRSECTKLGRLTGHPNIVTVHGAAVTNDDRPCIVMELYRGSYRDMGRMTIPEIVDIGMKTAEALGHVHRMRIVHRDLKPENIFVSEHEEPAIADFGISSVAGEQEHSTRFTLKYAPPELILDEVSNELGDIYSLGATLHHLATGRAPFAGDSDEALVREIISSPVPPIGRSEAPPELERLLRRCLAKDPSERPASAAEVAAELRRLQSRVGVPTRTRPTAADAPDPMFAGMQPERQLDRGELTMTDDRPGKSRVVTPSAPAPASAPTRSRRSAIIAGVAVVGVVVAAAGVLLLSGGDSDDGAPTVSTAVDSGPDDAGLDDESLNDFEVLAVPTDLTVQRVDGGFVIAWEPADSKVQLRRVGTDDNVIAESTPFDWTLGSNESGGDCFEARTVNDDENRLSQSAIGPVCAP